MFLEKIKKFPSFIDYIAILLYVIDVRNFFFSMFNIYTVT